MSNLPLIIGVTGASGLIYAVRALKYLLAANYSIELVPSKSAYMVRQAENNLRMPVEPLQQEEFWRYDAGVETGVRIMPAIPAWYDNPQSIEDFS